MNILFLTLLIIFTCYFFYRTIKRHECCYKRIIILLLYIIHIVSLFLFYNFNNGQQFDSYIFYERALNSNNISDFTQPGSKFMSLLIYPLVKLNISYFNLSLFFSTFSLVGFTFYLNFIFSKIKKLDSNILMLLSLLLILTPSLHFWTAGLTKEALVFYFMSIVFFQTVKKGLISFPLIISLVFILLIRPYLFGIILVSYFVFILCNIKMNKIMLVLLALLGTIISLPILKGFLRVDNLNFEEIQQSFQRIVVYSQNNGTSSIDLENSTYFYRMFLVLFKPIFYDSKTFFQYLISIENLITAIILFKFIFEVIKKKAYKFIFKQQVFLSLTVILLILFFSSYLYNLGLASRMRVMFMPYLYLLMFTFYAKIKNNRI